MFISQAINQDGSCQNIVNKFALNKDENISISNQKNYPQPKYQKEGLGFPISRLVGIISLTTSERLLLLYILKHFKKVILF